VPQCQRLTGPNRDRHGSSGKSYTVVDHKTSRSFGAPDTGQLILYAEYVRRRFQPGTCVGAFDQYRLVNDLKTARKAAFRRTPVAVERATLPALIDRYRRGWKLIARIHRDRAAQASDECWTCNPRYGNWY